MNDPKTAPVQMHTKMSAISSVFCIMFKHTSTILTNIINAAFKELRICFLLLDLKADVLVSI